MLASKWGEAIGNKEVDFGMPRNEPLDCVDARKQNFRGTRIKIRR